MTRAGSDQPRTLLAELLRARHWTTEDFCRHYEKASRGLPDTRPMAISDRQAKRWITGRLADKPYPAACLVLEHMFGRPIEDLLAPSDGTGPPAQRHTGICLVDHHRNSVDAGPITIRPSVEPPAFEVPAMANDAEETFRFLSRAENTPAPEILALLWNEVRRLSRAYGDHLSLFIDDLIVARKAVFRLLDGPTDPHQSRDLYLLGGLICAMLAHASRDLAQTERALMYQSTALLCAERSGHPGLHIIVRTEQAATAYWMGRYAESIQFTDLAAPHTAQASGSITALPAVQQARAYAAIGDTDRARHALTRSHDIRDQVEPDDLDAIGGLMRLSHPEQLGIAAGTAAWFPDPTEAERAATAAITAYQHAPHADRSHNSEAIAHADLALARVRQRALDGAHDALRPVLAIHPAHRVLPIREGVRRLSTFIQADPIYRTTPDAHTLTATIDDFIRTNAPRALPD